MNKRCGRLKKKIAWVFRESYKFILSRFDNYPYLSGDNMQKICDLTVSEKDLGSSKTTSRIQGCNSIFIEGHLLEDLIKNHATALGGKVVVSGNSDQNFLLNPYFPHPPKLFICQNLAGFENSKYRSLPIGIENLRLGRSGFKSLHKPLFDFSVMDRILLPPMSPTNDSRVRTRETARKRKDIFDVKDDFLPTSEYFELVRRYKFVFVCEGNGFDTHRLWEVLYQNSFPVVFRTDWAKSLTWMNLPILMVSELEELNSDLLENHLRKYSFRQPRDYAPLWMPFWEELINAKTTNES
jgi:hypothetical protein